MIRSFPPLRSSRPVQAARKNIYRKYRAKHIFFRRFLDENVAEYGLNTLILLELRQI